MTQPDRPCHHRLLWVGYALVLAVLVLLALAVNGAIDRSRLHHTASALDTRVLALNDAHTAADQRLLQQAQENAQQDVTLLEQKGTLKQQAERIRRQELALARLARLRRQDAHALTALHNELAVRYTDDAGVKQRLQQLEANNATARTVINTTPTPIDNKARP